MGSSANNDNYIINKKKVKYLIDSFLGKDFICIFKTTLKKYHFSSETNIS